MTKLDYINLKGNTILGRIKLINVLPINLSTLTLIEVGVGFGWGLVWFFSDLGVVFYYQ